MSVLQVSNIHFESSGNNRLQYTGSNGYILVAGGSNVAVINTSAISYPLDVEYVDVTVSGNLAVTGNATFSNTVSITGSLTVNAISANGGVGTSGQVLTSNGTTTYWSADILRADTADILTAGFAAAAYNAGTKSSGTYTPDEADGNFQYAVNGGAHTLAPPTNNCTIIIQYTNNGSAGAITTSGFTRVRGDPLTTTNGDDFIFSITKINGFSLLVVEAMQ